MRVTLAVLSVLLRVVLSEIDPTEYAALRVIRNGLEDIPGSTFFSTWDFTLDPCTSFRGVVCSSDSPMQHVVMLSLGSGFAGSPGLTGHLSPALGTLTSLRMLTLVPGSVRGPIPPELGTALVQLEFLGISKNGLTGAIPQTLSNLNSLQGLDLSNNKLTGSIPTALFHLPQLATLVLSANEFSGTLPGSVTAPLQRISLDGNELSGELPSTLPLALSHLDVSRNTLSGPITVTATLTRLTFLDLSFNSFTGTIPGSLFVLPNLSDLLLQRNRLEGRIEPDGPVGITRVDLSHNSLTGSPSGLLASVRNLLLNNNKLSGGVPNELVAALMAGDMQNLYLQHNFLSGIDRPGLLPQLLPVKCVFCIQYNCMQPPVQSSCPSSTGKQPSRPEFQCNDINGNWD